MMFSICFGYGYSHRFFGGIYSLVNKLTVSGISLVGCVFGPNLKPKEGSLFYSAKKKKKNSGRYVLDCFRFCSRFYTLCVGTYLLFGPNLGCTQILIPETHSPLVSFLEFH